MALYKYVYYYYYHQLTAGTPQSGHLSRAQQAIGAKQPQQKQFMTKAEKSY